MATQKTQAELPEEMAPWVFTCEDGTKLNLRYMSQRERDFFSEGPFDLTFFQWQSLTGGRPTTPTLMAAVDEVRSLAQTLMLPEDAEFVTKNFHRREHLTDLANLLKEILVHEKFISISTAEPAVDAAVPSTPEAVDGMGHAETERLGESSRQTPQLALSTPTTPAEEGSSTSTEPSPVKKRAKSA